MKNRKFPLVHLSVFPGTVTGMSAFAFVLILLCLSCSKGQTEDETHLQQAAAIYEESLQLEEQFKSQLRPLKSQPALQDSFRVLKRALEDWQISVIVVPGIAEDHGDHDDHEHHTFGHGHNEVQLTPEQMLEYQKEQRLIILSLQKRVQNMRDSTEHHQN